MLEDWSGVIAEARQEDDSRGGGGAGGVDSDRYREWAMHEAFAHAKRRAFSHTSATHAIATKLNAYVGATAPVTSAAVGPGAIRGVWEDGRPSLDGHRRCRGTWDRLWGREGGHGIGAGRIDVYIYIYSIHIDIYVCMYIHMYMYINI